MDLNGKQVLVFGTGISGIGAAKLLSDHKAHIILFDGNTKVNEQEIRAKLPECPDLQVILGDLEDSQIKALDLAVLSPGVPCDLPLVERIRNAGVPIWGEIELAFQCGKGDVLAITGTNGKTTSTSLLGEIMKSCRSEVHVVGNIGFSYTEAARSMTDQAVTVAEISSFQLETIRTFSPRVSAITNITPDHLNRHHTMEEYIRVKECITKFQKPDDTCVLNYEDPILRTFGQNLGIRVLWFSSARRLEQGLYLEDGNIWYADGSGRQLLCETGRLNLLGLHNYENVMTAAGMAIAYGVSPDQIRPVLYAFQAVEHRIEYVAEIDGVAYYNDSKGTNPDAAIKGIQAMNRPTVLIGGGYDKDSSYEEWIEAFDGKVTWLVLIGQTREKIAQAARACGFTNILFADSLEEAVNICAEKARPGDAVLLSPACASWGMFKNYEERGRQFKALVLARKGQTV